MFILAPLLLVSLPTPEPAVHYATTAELEAAVNVAVRNAVDDGGWIAADPYSSGTTLTVVEGEIAAHHIVEVDPDSGEGGTYRVEYERVDEQTVPADPDSLIAAGFDAGRGGVVIAPACGDWYFEGYLVERHATGASARKLIAKTLRGADDLEWVRAYAGEVAFALHRGEDALTLTVTIDDDGDVTAAELSRIAWHRDDGSYARKDELDRAMRSGRVIAIEQDGDDTVLVTARGRFVIDPDGDAFVVDPEREEVCGC